MAPDSKPGRTRAASPVRMLTTDLVLPPEAIGSQLPGDLELQDGYWRLRAGDVFDFGGLGRFTLKRSLGCGGAGEVFLAEGSGVCRPSFARDYALKVLRPDARPPRGRSFLDEVERLSAFRHSRSGRYFSYFVDHRRQVVVMDYVEGRSLRAVMDLARRKGQKLPEWFVLELTAQVAETLYWAHRAKDAKGRPLHLVHRDISPSSVIVTRLGFAMLVDFGLTGEGPGRRKGTGPAFAGRKETYRSPEQVRGKEVDGRSDQFSLCCVMLEMLTGEPPFGGGSRGTLRSAARVTPGYVDLLTRGLSSEVQAICQRGMARDPAQRYEDASEMTAVIRANHPYRGARDAEDELIRLDALPDAAPGAGHASGRSPLLVARRRRLLGVLAAALAVAGAGVVGWAMGSGWLSW